MDGIHADDIGYNTRVFEVTSVKLNTTAHICVGKVHDDNGKPVYNVYEVKGGHVTRRIGYYEKGEDDFDDANDFNVAKREEPEWTVEGKTFAEIPEHKRASKVKEVKEVKESSKVPKSMFTIKNNAARGDCFFEAVLGGEGKPTNDVAISTLRDNLVDYIEENDTMSTMIFEHYNIHKSSKIKDTYPELVEKLTEAGEDVEKLAAIKQDIIKIQKDTPKTTLTYDILLKVKDNEDERLPKGVLLDEETHFMHDYFNDNFELEEKEDIIGTYSENLANDQVWADNIVIEVYQNMKNIILLIVDDTGDTGRIEDGTARILPLRDELIEDVEKFIILKYSGDNHYELVCLKKNCKFDWKDVPDIIKHKFALSSWYATINDKFKADTPVEPAEEPEEPADEVVAVSDGDVTSPDEDVIPSIKPAIEDGEVDESESDVESHKPAPTPVTKPVIVTKPAPIPALKPVTVPPTAPTVPPPAPKPAPKPVTVSSTKTKKAEKKDPTTQFTKDQLNKLTISQLKDFIESNPDTYRNYKKSMNKAEYIDCILDPTIARCYKLRGGKFTRKL
jgi:hypothetical protein